MEAADMRWRLAIALEDAGRPGEAVDEYGRVERAYAAVLGANHLSVADAQCNAALLCVQLGRHAEALAILRRALRVQQAALGPDAPEPARTRVRVGDVLRAQGLLDDALREYRAALAAQRRGLGQGHPDCAVTAIRVADVCAAQCRGDEALLELTEALEARLSEDGGRDREGPGGEEADDVTELRWRVARAREALGDHVGALREYARVVEALIRRHGPGAAAVANAREHAAQAAVQAGRYEEARGGLLSALVARETLMAGGAAGGDEAVGRLRAALGDVCRAQGRHEEALREYERALQIRTERVASAGAASDGAAAVTDVAATREDMSVALEALGRYAEAASELEQVRLKMNVGGHIYADKAA